eukprot:539539-Rhodomonas_salina.3
MVVRDVGEGGRLVKRGREEGIGQGRMGASNGESSLRPPAPPSGCFSPFLPSSPPHGRLPLLTRLRSALSGPDGSLCSQAGAPLGMPHPPPHHPMWGPYPLDMGMHPAHAGRHPEGGGVPGPAGASTAELQQHVQVREMGRHDAGSLVRGQSGVVEGVACKA